MIRGKTKLILAGYAVLACSVIMCGTSLAYFVDHDASVNSFTVGSQVSKVNEVWDPPDEMKKDAEYEKKVAVKNTGTTDCYVRVFAEIEDDKNADSISADWNTRDWTAKQADGYYYYKSVLKPGESTKPLITTLTASADVSRLDMIVYEESVQAMGAQTPQKAFDF